MRNSRCVTNSNMLWIRQESSLTRSKCRIVPKCSEPCSIAWKQCGYEKHGEHAAHLHMLRTRISKYFEFWYARRSDLYDLICIYIYVFTEFCRHILYNLYMARLCFSTKGLNGVGPGGPGPSRPSRRSRPSRWSQVQRSVHLALFVSGWIRDVSDFRQPWLEAAKAIRRTPGEKKGPFCYSDSQNMPEPCASYGLIMLWHC